MQYYLDCLIYHAIILETQVDQINCPQYSISVREIELNRLRLAENWNLYFDFLCAISLCNICNALLSSKSTYS